MPPPRNQPPRSPPRRKRLPPSAQRHAPRPTTTNKSFPKQQRLCSRKAIEALFAAGSHSLSAYPLRVVFREHTDSLRVMTSVSKRHFKHAVDRNRAKRQIREAWRLNHDILPPTTAPMDIAFVWLSDQPQPSELVQRKMKKLLHRIDEQVNA
ncbi:MAG: ribonuclease P protein component [Bacteroidaceae bacterium]|nr:ribonuclease P protein component [Bacteroidaceae bacterium]